MRKNLLLLKSITYILAICLFLPLTKAHSDDFSGKIIDGTLVPESSYPMVAKIYVGESICTGTLISSKHVLTAGHCFYDQDGNKITQTGKMEVYLSGNYHSVKKATVNPSYRPRNTACIVGEIDATVIELNSEVSGITPVALMRSSPNVGDSLLLAGFGTEGNGQTGENGNLPPDGYMNIGYTSVDKISSNLYVDWLFNSGESNTASGDSGGPAFIDVNGSRYLHSITCGGSEKAEIGTESTNTRVDAIASWIDSVISGVGSTPPPGGSFNPSKVKVDFGDNDNYTLLLKGSLNIGSAFKPKGAAFKISVAGYSDSFKLSSDGTAYRRNGDDYVELSGKMSKGTYKSSTIKFDVGLVDKDKLYDSLAAYFPEDAPDSYTVELPITIVIKGVSYSSTVTMRSQKNGIRWSK